MKVKILNEGDFSNILKELESVSDSNPKKVLETIGEASCKVLSINSPVDTGELAKSWEYEVTGNKNGYELNVFNKAHHDEVDNLPYMLEYGHGTGTGGWVPGTHFISRSMNEVTKTINEEVEGMMMHE